MSGRFIVIEGPDGAGTTTHSRLLAESLRKLGQDVVLTGEPTDGAIGGWVRQAIKKGAFSPVAIQLMFTADRAWHAENVIVPALKAGKTVVCDRYVHSTLIYGAAQGVDAGWLLSVNAVFPKADTCIFLLPPFETCMERIGRRAEKDVFEEESLQRKVYEGYLRMTNEDASIRLVDTGGEKEAAAGKILQWGTAK